MLCQLSISNFALIDQLDISLQSGFTTITGETGAGKSILLGALSLVLGSRVQSSPLRDAERKCVIEARFDVSRPAIFEFLQREDFDNDNPLIVRREIAPSGKSRAFINDTPANLNQLKDLGALLIDIHSQHENLSLTDASFRLFVLDAYAGLLEQREACKVRFYAVRKLKQKLAELEEKQARQLLDQDYYRFLLKELDELQPKEGELSQMESELARLQHAEDIKTNLHGVVEAFDESGGQLIGTVEQVKHLLAGLKDISSDFMDLYNRLESVSIELEDLRAEVEAQQESVEHDPQRIAELSDRVDALNSLLFKHQLTEEEQLIEKWQELKQRTDSTDQMDEEIQQLRGEWEKAQEVYQKEAQKLSKKRQSVGKKLAEEIEGWLRDLGMPKARIQMDVQDAADWGEFGKDKIDVLFSANSGSDLQPVHKVASGGELSRVMLAIKFILSKKTSMPSIIFDEIDTGVSGEIANKMGDMMKGMSLDRQVISITHLPQIAAKGVQHLRVYKEHIGEETHTRIKPLATEERILELAKMLSGEEVSSIAKENARILLNN
ncbi:DNA repair protein RecN [bacterium SCSIO 12741]|nr:DNA repair protein RecN [bacterium SCSIO 12741]